MKTVPINVWIVPIILLTVAILAGVDGTRLPYGYFTFMRIVIFLAAGCIAAVGFRDGKQLWATMFVLIAVLFNPFVPIEMKRDDWLIFDIITFVVFLAHTVVGRLAGIRFISENIDRKRLRGILSATAMILVLISVCGLLLFVGRRPSTLPRQDINFDDLIPRK
jgi:hypothetical protein